MDKKLWAILVVAVLVLCPVAIACVSMESASFVPGSGTVFDPEGGGTSPDGVEGNDPEHPQ